MTITKRYVLPALTVTVLSFAGAACGGSSDSAGSFCDTVEKLEENDGIFDDTAGEPGTEEFAAAMEKSKQITDELDANAPSEIAEDTRFLANAVDILIDLDFTDTEALLAASEELDEAKLDKATANIERYAKSECGVDIASE